MKLKKSLATVLSLAALFSMSTALVGCGDKPKPEPDVPPVTNNDETVVNSVLDGLTVPSTVEENFTLTTSGVGGAKISWSSANADLISIVGGNATVVRPTDKDTEVKITATVTLNSVEKKKDFTVTVKMQEDTSMDISDVLAAEDGTSVEIKGVVTGIAYKTSKSGSDLAFGTQGYWVSDSTGTIYVYGDAEVEKGNLVHITGSKKIDTYFESKGVVLHEIEKAEVTVLKESETTPAFSYATEITISDLKDISEGCAGKVYKIIAAPTVYKNTKGGYVNFELMDAEGNYINEYANTGSANLDVNAERYEQFADFYDNNGVAKVCYFAVQGKSKQGDGDWRVNLLAIETPTDDQQAQFDATKALVELEDEYSETTEVDLKAKSNVAITVSTNNYVSYADGKIKITALPAEAVEVTVTAKATVNNVTKEATKTITVQKAAIMTIAEVLAAEKNAEIVTKGTISAVSTKGYVITDGVNGIYVYGKLSAEYKVGDVVQVSATKDIYYKGPQLKNAQLTKLTETASANPTCVTVDAAKITSYLAAETQYEILMGTISGKYIIDNDYRNIEVEGSADYKISLHGLTDEQRAGFDAAKDQTVVVEGWVITANSSSKVINVVVAKITLNGTELKPGTTTDPEPTQGVVSQLKIVDKAFSDTTWTYITNNPEYPNAGFYGTNGKKGLKLNFENMGVKSNTFAAQNKVTVSINIYAFNPKDADATSASTDFFTIKGYNAAGEVVDTAALTAVVEGEANTVTLEGEGIVSIEVVMTGYPVVNGVAQNVNLGGVTVSKAE